MCVSILVYYLLLYEENAAPRKYYISQKVSVLVSIVGEI